jgi:histidinol dehydrogenase
MALKLSARDSGFTSAFAAVVSKSREAKTNVDDVAARVLADVKARGDAAVIDYCNEFDRLSLTPQTMAFTKVEIDGAASACDANTLTALRDAAERIRAYHLRQLPLDEFYTDPSGIGLGWRWTALESAGLYVPGGTAALFSSVLMNAIPAKVAGVDRLVVTMPTPDGKVNPLTLAACAVAGVDEVYRVGGAQAIAMLAYGTQTVKAVDKIVGPGNAYVTSAKKQVFGTVGIDMIAGPSEVTVVSDAQSDPAWIAADLLAQAEHDASSQSILITDDAGFADRVIAVVEKQLQALPRRDTATQSWNDNGTVIVVEKLEDAAALVNQIAPEHLELAVAEPYALMKLIRHAGAIFLGRNTPEAVGDYIAGPSHVLPTSGAARFSSGLGVLDFLKRTSLIDCGSKGLAAIGPGALAMAQAEVLDAHAASVALRLSDKAR